MWKCPLNTSSAQKPQLHVTAMPTNLEHRRRNSLSSYHFDKEHVHPPGLLLVPVPVLLAAHISPPVRLADLFITMMPPNFYPSELRLFYFFEIQESWLTRVHFAIRWLLSKHSWTACKSFRDFQGLQRSVLARLSAMLGSSRHISLLSGMSKVFRLMGVIKWRVYIGIASTQRLVS